MNTAYYAQTYLKESKGQVVAVSSVAGEISPPFLTFYAAAKHAIHGCHWFTSSPQSFCSLLCGFNACRIFLLYTFTCLNCHLSLGEWTRFLNCTCTGFFEALRNEEPGYAVTIVCPGYVATEIDDKKIVGDGTSQSVELNVDKSKYMCVQVPVQLFMWTIRSCLLQVTLL